MKCTNECCWFICKKGYMSTIMQSIWGIEYTGGKADWKITVCEQCNKHTILECLLQSSPSELLQYIGLWPIVMIQGRNARFSGEVASCKLAHNTNAICLLQVCNQWNCSTMSATILFCPYEHWVTKAIPTYFLKNVYSIKPNHINL